MTTVGGDPDELTRLAAGGPGQAFTLDHCARLVAAADTRHRARTYPPTVDARSAVAGLRWMGRRILQLDAWVLRVAAHCAPPTAKDCRAACWPSGPPIPPAGPCATAVPGRPTSRSSC